MSASLKQLVDPGVGGRLDAMHQALNMGDQNIIVLQKTLTGLCNVIETLDQKIHHMYQNGTAQLIGGISIDAPRDDFEVQLSTLIEELDGVRKLTEGGGFSTVVGDLNYLMDVTIWV